MRKGVCQIIRREGRPKGKKKVKTVEKVQGDRFGSKSAAVKKTNEIQYVSSGRRMHERRRIPQTIKKGGGKDCLKKGGVRGKKFGGKKSIVFMSSTIRNSSCSWT